MENTSIYLSIERLAYLCEVVPAHLVQINEEDFVFQSSPEKWSKKQILGHLIDSAANNHQRFIRIQYEEEPTIYYDQNEWNRLHHYNEANTKQLIDFWKLYNQHLLSVLKYIPQNNLSRKGFTKAGEDLTLQFFINDYVQHLEHHLRQILGEDVLQL